MHKRAGVAPAIQSQTSERASIRFRLTYAALARKMESMKDTEPDPLEVALTVALATFDPHTARIAELVENAKPLLVATDAPYAQVREARLELFRERRAIDNRREELKRPALDFGKAVDKRAKELIALVEPTEKKLKAREDALEAEIAAAKAQAEREALVQLETQQARFRAVGKDMPIWMLQTMEPDAIELEFQEAERAWQVEQELREAERIAKEKEAAERAEREAAEREAERARAAEAERLQVETAAELERVRAELAAAKAGAFAEESAKIEAERKVDVAEAERDVAYDVANRTAAIAADEHLAREVELASNRLREVPGKSEPAPAVTPLVNGVEVGEPPSGAPTREELWAAIQRAHSVVAVEPVDEDDATKLYDELEALIARKEAV